MSRTLRERADALTFTLETLFHDGDRAALRRSADGATMARALLAWEGEDDELRDTSTIAAVKTLAQAIAIAGASTTHLGKALAAAGFSEARLDRLLRADAASLPDQALTAARFLAGKGQGIHAGDLADLLLNTTHGERVRLAISRDFYRSTLFTTESSS